MEEICTRNSSVKYEQIHIEPKSDMLTTQREFTNPKWKTADLEQEYTDNSDAVMLRTKE